MFIQFTLFCLCLQLAASAPIHYRSARQPIPSEAVERRTVISQDKGEHFVKRAHRKAKVMNTLFPVETIQRWTTAPGTDETVPLGDDTFQPTRDSSGSNKKYSKAKGRKVLKAHYPEGSFKPSHEPKGGFSFYASGPSDVDLTTAKEATFGFSVMFPDGFDFVLAGKLPGFCEFPASMPNLF